MLQFSGVQRFLDARGQTRFLDARDWTNPLFISGKKSTFSDKLNFAIFPKKTFGSPPKISDDLLKSFTKNVTICFVHKTFSFSYPQIFDDLSLTYLPYFFLQNSVV